MDQTLQGIARDHRMAARLHLAWAVEQTAQALGIADRLADENGDGPFMQAHRALQAGR